MRYYATGVDESALVSDTFPTNGTHRPNVVRLVDFDDGNCVRLEIDLDLARGFLMLAEVWVVAKPHAWGRFSPFSNFKFAQAPRPAEEPRVWRPKSL